MVLFRINQSSLHGCIALLSMSRWIFCVSKKLIMPLALTSRKDGHKCRQEARGKRYEFGGIVFFTDQDDRWGLAGLSFTEQVTGYRVPADVLTGRKAKPEFLDRVREIIGKVPPVMSLPEADLEDVWTGRPISGGDDK